jgi:3',5'-cyclic-AMP phosphodiesterase
MLIPVIRKQTPRPTSLVTVFIVCLFGAFFAQASEPVLRFAVLGDAEPKPEPRFPHMQAAVSQINAMSESLAIDFVAGVGDIAHKGTLIQYEAATAVLRNLILPFYPIMGNEEHGASVERYLEFARRWNSDKNWVPATRYTWEHPKIALVFASPDFGRDFSDEGIAWMVNQLKALHPKPVMLVVHAAQAGVFKEAVAKGVHHPGFAEVVRSPNLMAVISGDLHMDMDRVGHSFEVDNVHYLHIPALERTKIPDEDNHTPMFRVITVLDDGTVDVDTYKVGVPDPQPHLGYTFKG